MEKYERFDGKSKDQRESVMRKQIDADPIVREIVEGVFAKSRIYGSTYHFRGLRVGLN